MLSDKIGKFGIKHNVLNAKYHEREAEIIAQAGREAAVTIATNMAGRGTDIILGGNPEYLAWDQLRHHYASRLDVPKVGLGRADGEDRQRGGNGRRGAARSPKSGGLHVIGTERHEARRIDLQLRGRSGRQGDPGSSRFFLSLEDDLMRIFAGDWVKNMLTRLGMQEGEAIESRMVTRRIEAAQKKVEERHFDMRKHLLEYDEVMDEQRKQVYSYRQRILDGGNCRQLILDMIDKQIAADGAPSARAGLSLGNDRRLGRARDGHGGRRPLDRRDGPAAAGRITSATRPAGRPRTDIAEKIEEDLPSEAEDQSRMELAGPLEMGQRPLRPQHERSRAEEDRPRRALGRPDCRGPGSDRPLRLFAARRLHRRTVRPRNRCAAGCISSSRSRCGPKISPNLAVPRRQSRWSAARSTSCTARRKSSSPSPSA